MTSIAETLDLALRLHREGRLGEALEQYTIILGADPDHAAALHYSGLVLHQSGDSAGGIERIRRSISIDPNPAEPWSNLALALEKVARPEAAVNALLEAAKRAPNDPQVRNNLAASLLSMGRVAEAESHARAAVAEDPSFARGWYNLALALDPQGRVLEAIDAASRAHALAPEVAAHAGLKAQLQEAIGELGLARKTLESALVRFPMISALHNQLAEVALRQGDLATALSEYEHALRQEPDNGAALSQLLFLRKRTCDWRDLRTLQDRFRAGVLANRPLLSPFSFLSDSSTLAMQRACAQTWVAPFLSQPAAPARSALGARRLRVGYLSGDFYDHPTAVLVAGVFEAHDRSRFEIIGYSTSPDDRSALRSRVMFAVDRFIDAREASSAALARRIHADEIDLLVDLKGHTEGGRIDVLAHRPAPIQAHWLGYPGTLGAPFVDYLIGDAIVTPLAEAAAYAETLIALPNCYQSNDRSRTADAAPTRADVGLPRDSVVLCSFNNTYKINPDVFDAWARIMTQARETVLWLLARGESDPAIDHLRREAIARGIDPQRLVFATHRAQSRYLALYRHADLFLDTWPYNAHTTASDALWMGCPLLTIKGSTFAGRVASSVLSAVGLPELIAEDIDAYVAAAVALVRDQDRRRRLRAFLEGTGRESALFDVKRFTRSLERAYLEMATQFRAGRRQSIALGESAD
jgi:predicted O-linked N-acetylglucosamine transferase (SPINDLY family)